MICNILEQIKIKTKIIKKCKVEYSGIHLVTETEGNANYVEKRSKFEQHCSLS